MNPMISLFIDNELDLDEKIDFVRRIHADADLAEETIRFLEQEKCIDADVVEKLPGIDLQPWNPPEKAGRPSFSWAWRWLPLSALAAAGLLLMMLVPRSALPPAEWNRFVIYRPDAAQAEISGSFTNWERVGMKKAGDTGYFEITLKIPPGEHRYTYILDGRHSMPDPTVPAREVDDFGGYNSILQVEERI